MTRPSKAESTMAEFARLLRESAGDIPERVEIIHENPTTGSTTLAAGRCRKIVSGKKDEPKSGGPE